jgi:hypothetical protein
MLLGHWPNAASISPAGTVMVLTTPDANRTMLSYLGTPAPVVLDARLEAAIAHSRLLVIEGYVWEMPDAVASISAALEVCGCCWKRTCRPAVLPRKGYRHHDLFHCSSTRTPQVTDVCCALTQVARAHGTLVALTAGDAGLAVRKREELWGALHTGVDLLFTNRWTRCCASMPGLTLLSMCVNNATTRVLP